MCVSSPAWCCSWPIPVLLFMASRSSRFSFFRATSSFLIEDFSFSSFSFSVRNLLASSSARFFPYLYWLASAETRMLAVR